MEPLNIELDLRHPNVDMGFRNAFRHLCTLKTRAISLTFIVPPLLPLNIEFELLHSVVRRSTSRNLNELWSQIIALSWSPKWARTLSLRIVFTLNYNKSLDWTFTVLAHRKNSPHVDTTLHAAEKLSWFRANQSFFLLINYVC